MKPKHRPRDDEMRGLLYTEISRYSKVFIVVDALDECPPDSQKALLDLLNSMKPMASLLVTSRVGVESLEDKPEAMRMLQIRASVPDLKDYIKGRISSGTDLSRNVARKPGLAEEIMSIVSERSQGM